MTDTKLINALSLVINEAMKCKQTATGIALAIVSSQAWDALARQCSGRVLSDSVWGESTRDVPLSVQERGLISEEINDDATPAVRLRQLGRVLLADSGHRRNEIHQLRVQVAEVKASRARYRTAWRVARTRARSTGSAADRYAARARGLQTAMQEAVFVMIAGQMERDELRERVAELTRLLKQAQAEARAALGDPEPAREVPPEPSACARCDIPRLLHGRRYTEQGGHMWVRPSDEQVLARMRARRAARGGGGRG
ncbi:hypothetical protein [Streptomyces chrestomyceticus]|uniref:hypothetical protein n=1 Tax=Streptomyces chrestomyceticus TaxID=68185 RepID=UPI0033FDF85D